MVCAVHGSSYEEASLTVLWHEARSPSSDTEHTPRALMDVYALSVTPACPYLAPRSCDQVSTDVSQHPARSEPPS